MPKLKSLFGGGARKFEEDTVAVAENMSSSNIRSSSSRSPSVVARLMGLEMLPESNPVMSEKTKKLVLEKRDSNTLVDITVSGKQLNVVTGRNTRKSKSFDEAFSKLDTPRQQQQQQQQQPDKQRSSSMDFQVRAAPQQHEAECLQTIQLEELNKQLMVKHLQVLEELNEARQQLSYERPSSSSRGRAAPKGLSDSTEFLDAVELLQANRQFFQKYFQSTGALQSMLRKGEQRLKVANRIPQYLSGHSSPRPPLRDFEQNGDASSLSGSNIVVLKPRKAGKPKEEYAEKPAVKDTKDIAKMIAKKIKESITKEVAKTFYSKLDSAVSPQKGSDSEAAPRKKQAGQTGRKKSLDVSDNTPPRKKVESQSPKAKRQSNGSPTKQQQQQLLSKAGSEVAEDGIKLDCSKNARVLRSQRAAEKKRSDSKSKPAVKGRVVAADAQKAPKQKSSASPKLSRALRHTAETKPLKEAVDAQAGGGQADIVTPTKAEKEQVDLNENKSKSSPVSVLELIDEDDDDECLDDLIVKTVDIISSSNSVSQEQLQSEFSRRCEEPVADQAFRREEEAELTCPPGREDDFTYLKKLVAASSRKGMFEQVLEPSLFEALEDEYNQQNSEEIFAEPIKGQLRAVNRWMIFDVVNEVLSRDWGFGGGIVMKSERQAMKLLWSGICRLESGPGSELPGDYLSKDKNNDSSSLQNLARFDLNAAGMWDESCVPEMCQQLENALFNNLIDEAMADFLQC